jgi:flagellar biosynthesis GTPase FlhF
VELANEPESSSRDSEMKKSHDINVTKKKLPEQKPSTSKTELEIPRDHLANLEAGVSTMKVANNQEGQLDSTIKADEIPKSSSGITASLSQKSQPIPKPLENSYQAVAALVDSMVSVGVKYIGYNGLDVPDQISKHANKDTYVLWFSTKAMKDGQSWSANHALLTDLVREQSDKNAIFIVDCDAIKTTIDKAHVSHFINGEEVSSDVLQDRRFAAAGKWLTRRKNEELLETVYIQKPIKRRFIRIACPGIRCSEDQEQQWTCSHCMAALEYGFSDQYIYCECGRSIYSNLEFKCTSKQHGPYFNEHQSEVLLSILQSLVQSNNLNILILGETGVGKSTFINAFINCLEFDTLDDAIKNERLNWAIPSSFSIQILNEEDPKNRYIEEKDIRIGSSVDESDGSRGDSATQRTIVYPVTFTTGQSTYTVRLIDTPGIGDTRGVE